MRLSFQRSRNFSPRGMVGAIWLINAIRARAGVSLGAGAWLINR